MKNILAKILLSLICSSLLFACSKGKDTYSQDNVLRMYNGYFTVQSFTWLGGEGLPKEVDIDGDGKSESDLLAETDAIDHYYRMPGAHFTPYYEAEGKGVLDIYIPVLDYIDYMEYDMVGDVKFWYGSAPVSVSVLDNLSVIWGGFKSFEKESLMNDSYIGRNAVRDGEITELTPDSITLTLKQYLVLDLTTRTYYNGAVQLTYIKSKANTD